MTHFLKLFLVISPNGEDFDGDEYVFFFSEVHEGIHQKTQT